MAGNLYYVSARDHDGMFIDDVLAQDEAQQFVKEHREGLIEWKPVKA